MDDTLVTGHNDEEHLQNLTAVFESIRYHGFRINLSSPNTYFSEGMLNFLGHVMSREGIHTSNQSNHKYLLSNKCCQIAKI